MTKKLLLVGISVVLMMSIAGAYVNNGGGVIYIPPGNYTYHDEPRNVSNAGGGVIYIPPGDYVYHDEPQWGLFVGSPSWVRDIMIIQSMHRNWNGWRGLRHGATSR